MPRPPYYVKCSRCGTKTVRSDTYDAYFCPKCDIWLETKCSDPNCEFCSKRPEKPSDIVTEHYYQKHIPRCCKLKTVKEHKEMMLCWGLIRDMESGIDTTHRKCGRECDLHTNYDPKLLDKILRRVEKKYGNKRKDQIHSRQNPSKR